MLIRNPDALTPSDRSEAITMAGGDGSAVAWFEVYRNGVLDHMVNGSEGLLRNRMSILYNLHPDDSWDYAPADRCDVVAAE